MAARPMLEKHARLRLALALIARRTRLSIVHQETDIARDALRALYRELHGASAPSGPLPSVSKRVSASSVIRQPAALGASWSASSIASRLPLRRTVLSTVTSSPDRVTPVAIAAPYSIITVGCSILLETTS